MEKLYTTLQVTVDNYQNLTVNYSVFMIAIKGKKIAFYHCFAGI